MARPDATWSTRTLCFEGRYWPSARVIERRNLYDLQTTPIADEMEPVPVALIRTSGRGRVWATLEAAGFWRSFAELNLENNAAIEDFVRRHGDLDGELTPKVTIHTGNWKCLQQTCQIF